MCGKGAQVPDIAQGMKKAWCIDKRSKHEGVVHLKLAINDQIFVFNLQAEGKTFNRFPHAPYTAQMVDSPTATNPHQLSK